MPDHSETYGPQSCGIKCGSWDQLTVESLSCFGQDILLMNIDICAWRIYLYRKQTYTGIHQWYYRHEEDKQSLWDQLDATIHCHILSYEILSWQTTMNNMDSDKA